MSANPSENTAIDVPLFKLQCIVPHRFASDGSAVLLGLSVGESLWKCLDYGSHLALDYDL